MPTSTVWILKYVQQCYVKRFWTISSLGALNKPAWRVVSPSHEKKNLLSLASVCLASPVFLQKWAVQRTIWLPAFVGCLKSLSRTLETPLTDTFIKLTFINYEHLFGTCRHHRNEAHSWRSNILKLDVSSTFFIPMDHSNPRGWYTHPGRTDLLPRYCVFIFLLLAERPKLGTSDITERNTHVEI